VVPHPLIDEAPDPLSLAKTGKVKGIFQSNGISLKAMAPLVLSAVLLFGTFGVIRVPSGKQFLNLSCAVYKRKSFQSLESPHSGR
jgi:hypothetical protein